MSDTKNAARGLDLEALSAEAERFGLTPADLDALRDLRSDPEEHARRLLYREHYGDVRAHAADIMRDILSGSIADPDALSERLHEEADGSRAVFVYTGALRTVYASENWDAGPEELGFADFASGVESVPELMTRAAYWALRTDLQERLGLFVSHPPEPGSEEARELGFDRDSLGGLDLDDSDTYPANAPELDREAVETAAARTAFVLAWADAEERDGRTYPGSDLDDVAPDFVPGRFRAWARDVLAGALGATTKGDGIAEAWARADADTLGRALALSCGGWTDGLGEADLPHPIGLPHLDADVRLHVEPSEYRADVPSVEEIGHAAGRAEDPDSAAESIRAAIERGDGTEDVLAVANGLLRGFGVESLDLPAPDDDSDAGTVRYVNLGDTYTATLCYVEDAHTPSGRFVVSDWGTLLEQAEEERTYSTGEVRCPSCGDWTGAGSLDSEEGCSGCGRKT